RLIRQIELPTQGPARAWRERIATGRYIDRILEGQLVKVPPEAIAGVTFGASSRRWASYGQLSSLEEDVADIVDRNPALKHIERFMARLSRDRFALTIFDLDSASALKRNVDPLEFANREYGMMGRRPTKP